MSAPGGGQQELGLGLGHDEDIVVAASSNAEDARFDEVVGAIEEVIMEDEFQALQDEFMNKNYKHFEDSDENKLIYTTVHSEYVSLVEKHLDSALKRQVKGFRMDQFLETLVERKEELEGEIFELLLTFDDFLEFKQLMLSFKSVSWEWQRLDADGQVVYSLLPFSLLLLLLLLSVGEGGPQCGLGSGHVHPVDQLGVGQADAAYAACHRQWRQQGERKQEDAAARQRSDGPGRRVVLSLSAYFLAMHIRHIFDTYSSSSVCCLTLASFFFGSYYHFN